MVNGDLDLRFWRRREFVLTEPGGTDTDWWPYMSLRLLVMMDVFRFKWGARCEVSHHPRALGRHLGRSAGSQHNVDRWDEVRAADIFPTGAIVKEDARRLIDIAKEVGFTGIGIYPDWTNRYGDDCVGIHLDVRIGKNMGCPAMWGGIHDEGTGKQVYVSIEEVLRRM